MIDIINDESIRTAVIISVYGPVYNTLCKKVCSSVNNFVWSSTMFETVPNAIRHCIYKFMIEYDNK